MDKKISTLLREIKDTTLWSESQIAAKIGTSQPTVNRILSGQDDCRGSTLRAISGLHQSVFHGADSSSTEAASASCEISKVEP